MNKIKKYKLNNINKAKNRLLKVNKSIINKIIKKSLKTAKKYEFNNIMLLYRSMMEL